jgi:hypothetical protein
MVLRRPSSTRLIETIIRCTERERSRPRTTVLLFYTRQVPTVTSGVGPPIPFMTLRARRSSRIVFFSSDKRAKRLYCVKTPWNTWKFLPVTCTAVGHVAPGTIAYYNVPLHNDRVRLENKLRTLAENARFPKEVAPVRLNKNETERNVHTV